MFHVTTRPHIRSGTMVRLVRIVPVELGESFDSWLNHALDFLEKAQQNNTRRLA